MKALIIGATGATGSDLVKVLLNDADYTHVTIFVRRNTGIVDPKLTELITDFDHPEQVAEYMEADVLFSCLGTTLKAAGSKEQQEHIDLEIPLKFAAVAGSKGVKKAVLLSAYGASAGSSIFYSRLKGRLEEGMEQLNYDQLIIFRPGLLLRKNTDRGGERIFAGLLKFLNTIGIIRKFKPLPTSILAKKMAKAPKVLGIGKQVVELRDIFRL
jgi:uncharacterized protein YbjT (DUF2867 family)